MDDLLADFLAETTEGLTAVDDALLRLERAPQDRTPVGDQVFRLRQRQAVQRLQHQHANLSAGSKAGRPPSRLSRLPKAALRSARNRAKSTVLASVSRGAPCAESSRRRACTSRKPDWPADTRLSAPIARHEATHDPGAFASGVSGGVQLDGLAARTAVPSKPVQRRLELATREAYLQAGVSS